MNASEKTTNEKSQLPKPATSPMNTDTITVIERTNTRDGICYVLATDNGTPRCPHCDTPMLRVGEQFENAGCHCWWVGAARADYQLQVVVPATAEGEQAYRDARAAAAREWRAQQQAAEERANARRAARAGKKAITKLHFVADDFGTMRPRYMPEAVEVTIERCYVRDFSAFQGGGAEVMDVVYPDGRKFYIRASQIERILD